MLRALNAEPPTLDDVWQQQRSAVAIVRYVYVDATGVEGTHARSLGHTGINWRPPAPPRPSAIQPFRGPGPFWRNPLDAQSVRLDLNDLKRPVTSQAATVLDSTGANLANVIDTLPRSQAIQLASEFCRLVPVYHDVDTPPAGPGQRTIRFFDRWNPKVSFLAHQVSDGTLFALAMLTLKYQQPAPAIITIEEPERGLHPYLLQEVIKVLRLLTEGESAVQVILATQSAELLEYVSPEEVRFFTKDPHDGAVKISSVDTTHADWKTAYAEYENSLRDAWLSGTLGGVPGGSSH